MIHNNTKYWAFTWSRNIKQHQLPKVDKLKKFLNMNSDYAVFQLERGEQSGKEHYQGALILSGSRKSRSQLLELFKSCFQNVAGLTLSRIYDKDAAMAYACKIETRISGPYFIGRYEQYDEKMAEMKLKTWQQDLYDFLLQKKADPIFRDRKIIWVEDSVGNSGKSWFLKYLRTGQRELVARKLPFTNVDRLVSAVRTLSSHTKFDLLMVNITKTIGRDQNFDDLYAILEEVKDGFVVDAMYGRYQEAIFDSPLVLVFTNRNYRDNLSKLSVDRWFGLYITSDGEISHHVYDENGFFEVKKLRDLIE